MQIGHGVIQLILDEAHLLNITVRPQSQGQGYGLQLLEHLMAEAGRQGGRECFLEVRASNQSAYRLYERFGFNEIGRRRDYYPAANGREDALVMACTQALELRERQTPTPATPAVRAFCAAARRITPFLDEDRPLEGELRALVAALQHRDWELYPNA